MGRACQGQPAVAASVMGWWELEAPECCWDNHKEKQQWDVWEMKTSKENLWMGCPYILASGTACKEGHSSASPRNREREERSLWVADVESLVQNRLNRDLMIFTVICKKKKPRSFQMVKITFFFFFSKYT